MFSPNGGLSSPLTQKGDLWGFSTTDASVAVGTDGLFLKADSSSPAGVSWASAAGAALAVTTVTGAATFVPSLDAMFVNGNGTTYAITLANAASFSIKSIYLERTDDSVTLPITITGLINGSTNWAFYTQFEAYTLIPDGSGNWKMLNHRAETDWASISSIGITAVSGGSAPVKGASVTLDRIWWRRTGRDCHFIYEYQQQTAGVVGVNDYLFQVPQGVGTIDTNLITVYTTNEGGGAFVTTNARGSALATFSGGQSYQGCIVVYASNYFRIFFAGTSPGGGVGAAGPGTVGLNQTEPSYFADFVIPMTGWKP